MENRKHPLTWKLSELVRRIAQNIKKTLRPKRMDNSESVDCFQEYGKSNRNVFKCLN